MLDLEESPLYSEKMLLYADECHPRGGNFGSHLQPPGATLLGVAVFWFT